MNESGQYARREIYAGRVQGVGFRYTTRGIAERFSVRGYVRNLPAGTVELLACGRKDDVTAFLDAVSERFSSYINSAASTSEEVEPPEAFTGFEIRVRG